MVRFNKINLHNKKEIGKEAGGAKERDRAQGK